MVLLLPASPTGRYIAVVDGKKSSELSVLGRREG